MLKTLFSFEGRAGRMLFWMSLLGFWVVAIVIASMKSVIGEEASVTAILIWALIAIWPLIAIQVKRWHDRDKSGWWILINLIPVIGELWSLVENGFLKGSEGVNRFDATPIET